MLIPMVAMRDISAIVEMIAGIFETQGIILSVTERVDRDCSANPKNSQLKDISAKKLLNPVRNIQLIADSPVYEFPHQGNTTRLPIPVSPMSSYTFAKHSAST